MNVLRADEEVGAVVCSDRIDSFVFNDSSLPFKQLLCIINIACVEVVLLELVRDH